jgi:GAF domain-containing protein
MSAVPGELPEPEVVRRLEEVSGILADLAGVLDEEEELDRVLQRSVDQLTGAVPGADMASVTVLRGDTGETVAASSRDVWEIDQDQYAAGDGPCLEAARSGRVIRTGVEQARSRWPEFARGSRTAGVESYLSCPLFLGEDFVGSLNLYSSQRHGFADFDVALLELYVTAACAAIANARRYARARAVAGQLNEALDSRAMIDQATGIVMARSGLTAAEAFAVLARQSQNTNVKLRTLATRLVTGQEADEPRPDEPRPDEPRPDEQVEPGYSS